MTLACSGLCPQETLGQAVYATPVVANDEVLCRVVYSPRHTRKGIIKSSYLHRKMLRDGELSVWRVSGLCDIGALAKKLDERFTQDEQTIYHIFGATAERLRSIDIDEERAISVINDTRCDNKGGNDDQHAAIAPCRRFSVAGDLPSDEVIELLVNQLDLRFRNGTISQAF